MENKKINDIHVLLEPKVIALLFQTITDYVKHSSIKLPSTIKVYKERLYTDNKKMLSNQNNGKISAALMGTIVDYLTRIMVCHDLSAFDFLLTDLKEYPEFEDRGEKYLQFYIRKLKNVFKDRKIDDLSCDEAEIIVRLSVYESWFRSGVAPRDFLPSVNYDALENIKIMLHRSQNFFEICEYPKLNAYHSQFGGQLGIVSPISYLGKNISDLKTWIFGDGDYLLSDCIVDFKVSGKKNMMSSWKKQLLVYYLGLDEAELMKNNIRKYDIKYLAVFNPRDDVVYKINLSDISNRQMTRLYQQFISDIESYTHEAQNLVNKLLIGINTRDIATAEQAKRFTNPFLKYSDGIHTIAKYEYQRYCTSTIQTESDVKCNFPGTLYLIKRKGYYAFFVKSHSGLSLLNKGQRQAVEHDLQYYYDNIIDYTETTKKAFGGYQSALNEISREVKAFGGSGKNHGSIVNIDFFNHIYLDPLTHEIKVYYAEDILNRRVFPSVQKLLMTPSTDDFVYDHEKQRFIHHNEMLLNYEKNKAQGDLKLLDITSTLNLPNQGKEIYSLIVKDDDKNDSYYEIGYNEDMYGKSRIMLKIQSLLKYNTVFYWNDSVLYSQTLQKLRSQDNTEMSFKQMTAPIEDTVKQDE